MAISRRRKSKRHTHHKRHKHHSTHRRKVKRYSRRGTKRRRRKRTKRVKRGGTRKNVMKGGAGANSLYLYINDNKVKNYGYAKKAFIRIGSASSQDIQWKTVDKPLQDVPITESINIEDKNDVQNFIQYVLHLRTEKNMQEGLKERAEEEERLDTHIAKAAADALGADLPDSQNKYIVRLKNFFKTHEGTLNTITTSDDLVKEAQAARAAAAEEEGRLQAAKERKRREEEDEGQRQVAEAEKRREAEEAEERKRLEKKKEEIKRAEEELEAAEAAGLSLKEYQDAAAEAAAEGMSVKTYLANKAQEDEKDESERRKEMIDKQNKFTQLIINKEQIEGVPPSTADEDDEHELDPLESDVIEQLNSPPFNYLLELKSSNHIPLIQDIVIQKLKDIPLANTDIENERLAKREGISVADLNIQIKSKRDTLKNNATRDINLLKLQALRRILLIKAGMKLENIKEEENANSNWWDDVQVIPELLIVSWIKTTINNVVKQLFFNEEQKRAYPNDADLYTRVYTILQKYLPRSSTSTLHEILDESGFNETHSTSIAVTDFEVEKGLGQDEARKAGTAGEAARRAARAQNLTKSQADAAAEEARFKAIIGLANDDLE